MKKKRKLYPARPVLKKFQIDPVGVTNRIKNLFSKNNAFAAPPNRSYSSRIIALAIAFLMVAGAVSSVFPSVFPSGASVRAAGIADAFRLEQYLAGHDVEIDKHSADINRDGIINSEDALILRAYLAGHSVPFSPASLLPATTSPGALSVTPFADKSISIEVRPLQPQAIPGAEFDVQVYVTENPGVTAFELGLLFDAAKLELQSSTVAPHTDAPTPAIGANPVPIAGMTVPTFENSYFTGALITLHFRVRNDAPAGAAAFTLSGDVFRLDGVDLLPVTPVVTNDAVEILNPENIQLELRASQTAALPGENVDVQIYIAHNPGVALFDLRLSFDEARLEPRTPTATLQYAGAGIDIPQQSASPLPIAGFPNDLITITHTGTLMTFHFTVRDDASAGNAAFTLSGEVVKLVGHDLNTVMPDITNVAIEILCDEAIHFELRHSEESAERGEDVYVEIYIAHNPGIVLFDLQLHFDETRLELRTPTIAPDYPGMEMEIPYPANPLPIAGEVYPGFDNSEHTGTLVSVRFTVRENAPAGNAALTLTGTASGIAGDDLFCRDVVFSNNFIRITNYRQKLEELVADANYLLANTSVVSRDVSGEYWVPQYYYDKLRAALNEANRVLGTP